jgi:hypothetical protein
MEKPEQIAKYAVRFLLREGSLEFRANEKKADSLRASTSAGTLCARPKANEIETASGIAGISPKYRPNAKFGSLRATASPKVVFPSEDVKSSGYISSTL